MKILEYPLDCDYILRKKRKVKNELLESRKNFVNKKIAVLGGSTTKDIIDCIELFLLNYGIKGEFYESEYNKYFEDVIFSNIELENFNPDLIYIHTSVCNIMEWPDISDSKDDIKKKIENVFNHFVSVWETIKNKYNCVIIQNNFEFPTFRLFGNRDASDVHGRVNYINRLNNMFCEYASEHSDFFINDIQYLSSCYGLDNWSDSFSWYMYKYALNVKAIPILAHNVASIIKSVYGKNKKAFALDLDNTLWGGVIGDDGVDGLEIGPETSLGQAYSDFQEYIKCHHKMGIMLNICSKNEEENALAGLEHRNCCLSKDDFLVIKANWDEKSKNICDIAETVNIMRDSIVFVDDNPAEREIVRQQTPDVAVPEITTIENYIREIDRNRFFEVTYWSNDDLKRNEMYKLNAKRENEKSRFGNYKDYLLSLEMKANIRSFESIYFSRISQLTNKSNQFNLTTVRYSQADIEMIANDNRYITLYGKLEDKFGDNGVVSLVIGEIINNVCYLRLWLMSCRVLKRGMEDAMMDKLVQRCKELNINEIRGYYFPTEKNKMVKTFYGDMSFKLLNEDDVGNTEWLYHIEDEYTKKNSVIKVEE